MTTRNFILTTKSGFNEEKINYLESLDYKLPTNRAIFGDLYHELIDYIHSYFSKLGFPQNENIHLFMQHRMIEYFNKPDNNICVANEELVINIFPKNDINISLTIDDLKSIIDKCNKNIIFISLTINDFNHYTHETGPARHNNIFVINKEIKEFYAIEPNYGNLRPLNDIIQQLYYDIGEKLKIGYQGYLEQSNVSDHGDLCLFISVLSYFSNGTISYELIKSEVINYFKWELENIKNGILPCSSGLKFGINKLKNILNDIHYLKI
jgi:hypothetical protein